MFIFLVPLGYTTVLQVFSGRKSSFVYALALVQLYVRHFTKLVSISLLREIRLIVDLDDILIMDKSMQEIISYYLFTCRTLDS